MFMESWTLSLLQEFIYFLYLHFIINIQNLKIIYNLGNRTVLYLMCDCINGLVGV